MTRKINEIVLHASATRPNWMAGEPLAGKIAEITRWHRDRGFRTIGYHWVVDRDGEVAAGRPEGEVGAHVRGHNENTIGICILGGHGGATTDNFEDHYTIAQRGAVWNLIRSIAKRYDIEKVSGHNEYAAKACPCFQVKEEFPWPPVEEPKPSFLQGLINLIRSLFASWKNSRSG